MATRTVQPTPAQSGSSLLEGEQDSDKTPPSRSSRQLWMAALKPPMYCVAIMPICVGSAVAYAETGLFRWGVFFTFALSAILLLVWENLSNDVFDAETGIDINKHHSLVNLTRNRSLIFWLGNAALLLGIMGILAISLWQKDSTVLAMVLACCGLGYLYQGPPFRLGYKGVGEVLCFLSFGPLAVGAAYYSQVQRWSAVGWASDGAAVAGEWWQSWRWQTPLLPAALIVGIATTLVLFCSHFHQVEDDLNAGKRSPIVRLGTQRGARLLSVACISVLLTVLIAMMQGGLPLSALLLFGAAPAAVRLCRRVLAVHDQPALVSNAKFLAIHFHFWIGLLLTAALAVSRISFISL